MSSENPYQSPNLASDESSRHGEAGSNDWKSWAPGQTRLVKEVAANMTSQERRATMWRSAGYGLWCALSCGAPAGLLTIWFSPLEIALPPWIVIAAFGLVMAHVAFLPIWIRMQRRFLCETDWARSRRLKPEDMRLFPFLFR